MIILRLREQIRIYEQRTGERLTYAQLGDLTGLSRATIETLATRSTYNTTLSTIDKLCRALDCDVADLLEYRPDDKADT